MKTFTKLALAAASGYAFRAYTKKDVRVTEEPMPHPDDNQRVMSEGFSAFKSPFMNRQAEKLIYKVAEKITAVAFGEQYTRRYNPSRYGRSYYSPHTHDNRTRYARFGRGGS